MRDLRLLAAFELRMPGVPRAYERGGCFEIASPATGATLRVIATSEMGWDHVSVSTARRCPNWLEMCRVKELFFHANECAMQLHVPATDHINNHPYCLHLWRPHGAEIPRPPSLMVGVRGLGPDDIARMTRSEKVGLRDQMFGALQQEGGARG